MMEMNYNVALDIGLSPDKIILTVFQENMFRLGDKIEFWKKPNSCRTIVVKILGLTHYEIKTFVRPSRGYAKHIRRIKSNA